LSLHERNKIVPNMKDYDNLGSQWVPYLMRFEKPMRKLPSVSTDEHGFRNTVGKDAKIIIDYGDFANPKDALPRGILLGSSAAFGVGCSHDQFTLPSHLNRQSRLSWFNFGGRAFNSTQEVILFLLYLPKTVKKLLIFSGLNNLVLAYLAARTSSVYNSFFSQSVFEQAMRSLPDEMFSLSQRIRRVFSGMKQRILPNRVYQGPRDLDLQYKNILECFQRDMEVLWGLGKGYGFEIMFAFQPVATWIDKELTVEEIKLFSLLDELHIWKVLAEYIVSEKEQYVQDVRSICENLNIQFYDLNNSEEFRQKKWLFVDRVHLTDRGYALAAQIVKEVFQL